MLLNVILPLYILGMAVTATDDRLHNSTNAAHADYPITASLVFIAAVVLWPVLHIWRTITHIKHKIAN